LLLVPSRNTSALTLPNKTDHFRDNEAYTLHSCDLTLPDQHGHICIYWPIALSILAVRARVALRNWQWTFRRQTRNRILRGDDEILLPSSTRTAAKRMLRRRKKRTDYVVVIEKRYPATSRDHEKQRERERERECVLHASCVFVLHLSDWSRMIEDCSLISFFATRETNRVRQQHDTREISVIVLFLPRIAALSSPRALVSHHCHFIVIHHVNASLTLIVRFLLCFQCRTRAAVTPRNSTLVTASGWARVPSARSSMSPTRETRCASSTRSSRPFACDSTWRGSIWTCRRRSIFRWASPIRHSSFIRLRHGPVNCNGVIKSVDPCFSRCLCLCACRIIHRKVRARKRGYVACLAVSLRYLWCIALSRTSVQVTSLRLHRTLVEAVE